ncbi:MAG: sulfite exporter TauE/SafE family protein, partial [Actinomycetota bacterium]
MTPLRFVLGILVGFVAGIGSGLFGVGGGVVTTPAVNVLLGGSAIEAVATPLPVIFPTSLVGAWTYYKAGEVSLRAAGWGALTGIPGAILGAYLTDFVNAHLVLFVTALLLGWTGYQVIRGRKPRVAWEKGTTPGWKYAAIGLAAGFTSGLLGVGGGIIMVPAFTVLIGMPLRRALGTSLVTISALVVPGTIVHWWLGHIDWAIFTALTVGVIPGARLGAKVALGVREQSL